MAGEVIAVQGLAVRYPGHTALQVERLDVLPRETLAIIGPNGSGKSTLLRALALLERPDAGLVQAFGAPVHWRARQLLNLRRRIATVFQAPLLTNATVSENVALGLRFRHAPTGEIEARVGEWLMRFGISHLSSRQARTLSGGEAQRTSLARAFALRPEVLFLDEPFAALDPPTRDALLLDLEAILHQAGITAVFVTHDHNEALTLASRVGVMIAGRLEQIDQPRRVFGFPSSLAVARFVGVENLLEGMGSGGLEMIVAGKPVQVGRTLRTGEAVTGCLRSERVRLAASGTSTPAGHDAFTGTVTRVVALGGRLQVQLDVGFSLRAAVSETAAGGLRLEPGVQVQVSFPPDAIHVIGR